MSAASSGSVCEVHGAAAGGTCGRCGRFFCPECTGEPPNDDLCAECDRLVGYLPFEAQRDRRSFVRRCYATYLAIVSDPLEALRRFPREGPLRPALAFASIAVAAHAAVSVAVGVMAGAVRPWWESRPELWTDPSRWLHGIVQAGLVTGSRLLVTLAFVVLLGLLTGKQAPRAGVRVVAYGTAYLVLVLVPIVGLIALARAPLFLVGSALLPSSATRLPLAVLLAVLWVAVPQGLMRLLQANGHWFD